MTARTAILASAILGLQVAACSSSTNPYPSTPDADASAAIEAGPPDHAKGDASDGFAAMDRAMDSDGSGNDVSDASPVDGDGGEAGGELDATD